MSLHPDAEYAALQVAERAVAEYKARLALIGAAAPPSSHGHLRKLEEEARLQTMRWLKALGVDADEDDE